jgi:hypothetical protein
MKTKTEYDGWNCVPELKEAIDYIEECSSDIYEIKNCVRNSRLSDLIENIKNNLQYAIEELDGISDPDEEFETVFEDDEDDDMSDEEYNEMWKKSRGIV